MKNGDTTKNTEFGYTLAITLGTIVIGLVSYILYTGNISKLREAPRCEYNGWAYADKETYDSIDGCNTCFCHTGQTVCTQKECDIPELCDDGTVCPIEENLESPTP